MGRRKDGTCPRRLGGEQAGGHGMRTERNTHQQGIALLLSFGLKFFFLFL